MCDRNDLPSARYIAHFSDTTCDILPEMPVSISSKTIVPMSSTPARIFLKASINLDISPPEIIFASGLSGSPTFGEIINSTLSIPFADISSTSSFVVISTLNVEPLIPKSQSSFMMSFSNLSATFRLSSERFFALSSSFLRLYRFRFQVPQLFRRHWQGYLPLFRLIVELLQ